MSEVNIFFFTPLKSIMKKILIIEDDLILLELLKTSLEKKGYNVISERNGKNGLFAARKEAPDLTLLDLILPEMDGLSILKEIRKNKETKSLPVIVISNSGQPVEIEEIKNLGVSDYLVKTEFKPEELMEKINYFFDEEKEKNKENANKEESKKTSQNNNKKIDEKSDGISEEKKILIIEDDKFLKDILVKKFIKEGWSVMQAETAENSIELLKTETPQIILLDLLLPGMHGLEFLKNLKKNPATLHIPVIILSNFSEEKDIQTAMSFGAKDFLVKALSTPNEIIEKVKNVMEKSYI